MEELKNQLSAKTGVDEGTAEKISTMLKDNVGSLPGMLSGDARGLSERLQGLGLGEGVVAKVVAFLKEHAAEIPTWLAGEGGGLLTKAKELIGGVIGR
jgi:hypothetical protein